jgi:hypothetical protein
MKNIPIPSQINASENHVIAYCLWLLGIFSVFIGRGLRLAIEGVKLLATTRIGSVPSFFDNAFTSRANQILFF